MTSGNIRKFYILYWRHPSLDWENARTTEIYQKLIYDDRLRVNMRTDLDFRFMNCHRQTESYRIHKDTVEYYRRHKVRKEPLIFLELWQPNKEGRKEELWSIDSDYRMNLFLKTLDHYLNDYN